MEKLFTFLRETKATSLPSSSFVFYGEDWCYKKSFKEQQSFVLNVEPKHISFLSGVHAPVYTLGKSKRCQAELQSDYVQTDRGGQLMYHGPGQLTLYPIFKLNDFFSGPREYTKFMFDLCIGYFKEVYGLELKCQQNGLWFKKKKVGFIGLRIKNGVVYHGLSLNYDADLIAFKRYSPCDISGSQVGNLGIQDFTSKDFFKKEAEAFSNRFVEALKV